jgi:HK97 family phage major capsid protein
MPALKDLQEDMRKLSVQALEVVEAADTPTSEKRTKLDGIEADIKILSDQIQDEQYLADQRKKYTAAGEIQRLEESSQPGSGIVRKSVGEQFTESATYKAAAGGKRPKGWTSDVVELKATLTETAAGGTTGAGVVQPDVRPGILSILFQGLTVEDLLPGGATGTALVRYVKETVATNTAATVAEGGTKPEATLNFSTVDEPVRKIAETLKVTDEMFEDAPQMRSYVDNRLILFVNIATEAQLLTGDGTGSNLVGLLNRSGLTAAQAKGTDSGPDAIYKDITKIRVASFLEPTGIVMHPNDWQDIRLTKDSNNQYYGGGPFTGAYGNGGGMAPDMLWGKPVVVTQAMTENTALVGAFATAAQVFNRSGLTVEATNSNEDDFKKNLVAIRVERRLALACYRPAAFSTVTGL